jgi:hypothetical protein
MTAAMDDAVITHEVEYIVLNNYVNNDIILILSIFVCISPPWSFSCVPTVLPPDSSER